MKFILIFSTFVILALIAGNPYSKTYTKNELELEKMDKKRMGKWIRQRFLDSGEAG